MDELLRPSDDDAVRAELRADQRATGLPVLFGGVVRNQDLVLSGFVGTHGSMLRDLVINARCGLGGRAITERRASAVAGYAHSAEISHEYDRQVASEGIESLLAAPAVVAGKTRAVLYGGLRNPAPIGDDVVTRLVTSANRLAREIEIRDEVDRRITLLETSRPTTQLSPAAAESVVESYVELRRIADATTDPVLAEQLRAIGDRLSGTRRPIPGAPELSGRERDVLAHLALGCGNAEIADRLGIGRETVKAYLRSLMGKLDVHNRHEAVVAARRQGLLP